MGSEGSRDAQNRAKEALIMTTDPMVCLFTHGFWEGPYQGKDCAYAVLNPAADPMSIKPPKGYGKTWMRRSGDGALCIIIHRPHISPKTLVSNEFKGYFGW
jgi:hypothetical protein